MKKLDWEKLNKRDIRIIDMQSALRDITPVQWPEEVINGTQKIVVDKIEKEDEKCAKLEISFL